MEHFGVQSQADTIIQTLCQVLSFTHRMIYDYGKFQEFQKAWGMNNDKGQLQNPCFVMKRQ